MRLSLLERLCFFDGGVGAYWEGLVHRGNQERIRRDRARNSRLDFVRAIARRLPEPPIMQTVEPFNCTVEPGAVVIRSVPGPAPLQSDRLGAWRLCRDPLGFRDGARGAEHIARGHWLNLSGSSNGTAKRRIARCQAQAGDTSGAVSMDVVVAAD
jgi:hypothetical protein